MFFRLFLAALVPLCGMRGLQACIGAGHFHLELAHSHEGHCGNHAHKECPSNSSECGHYDDHVHIGLSIEDPAKKTARGIKINRLHRSQLFLPDAPFQGDIRTPIRKSSQHFYAAGQFPKCSHRDADLIPGGDLLF